MSGLAWLVQAAGKASQHLGGDREDLDRSGLLHLGRADAAAEQADAGHHGVLAGPDIPDRAPTKTASPGPVPPCPGQPEPGRGRAYRRPRRPRMWPRAAHRRRRGGPHGLELLRPGRTGQDLPQAVLAAGPQQVGDATERLQPLPVRRVQHLVRGHQAGVAFLLPAVSNRPGTDPSRAEPSQASCKPTLALAPGLAPVWVQAACRLVHIVPRNSNRSLVIQAGQLHV